MGISAIVRRTCALAVMVITVAACGTRGASGGSDQGGGSGGSKKIGVPVADQKSLFYIAAVDGMKKAAADAGVELVVLSADNNSTQQVNQVNDLITQKVGALIFIAQDATAAAAGVRAANRANIPVIAVGQEPESGRGK